MAGAKLSTGKPAKRGRPKKVEKSAFGQMDFDFDGMMKAVERSPDAGGMIMAMMAARDQQAGQWRGMLAVPPNSLIESVVGQFRAKSNIPLEIPFFTLLSIISGFLVRRNVVVETDALGPILPDIWTVVLASSGAGKTYTENKITKGLSTALSEIEFNGTGIVSGAAFVAALEKQPRGLWVRDEFAQFLKAIEQQQGPMSEMKDYMLRLYDNATISRETKQETITVEKPALTILGLTVLETFSQHVTMESMLDGFSQRFGYVIAKADPDRPWRDYPLWRVDSSGWDSRWHEIEASVQPKYFVNDELMMQAFAASFQCLYNSHIPESFFRRLMWRATKLALVYHVMSGDASPWLTATDFGWAARALSIHLDDAAWLIGDHNMSPFQRLLQSAETVIANIWEKEGRQATARDLIRGCSAIKTAEQARNILSIIGISGK